METKLKANLDHDIDQYLANTKRLVGRIIAQPIIAFFLVVVEFAVNGNQDFRTYDRESFC